MESTGKNLQNFVFVSNDFQLRFSSKTVHKANRPNRSGTEKRRQTPLLLCTVTNCALSCSFYKLSIKHRKKMFIALNLFES